MSSRDSRPTMTRGATPFAEAVDRRVRELGGYHNAHLHLDRSGTYEETLRLLQIGAEGASHLSLARKHAIIPLIHASPAYDPDRLEARVEGFVSRLVEHGATRADTVVDVTADRVGLDALRRLATIRDRRRHEIDLRVAAYTPLGFRDDEPRRWDLVAAAAEEADFIGGLPERDDRASYPEHIGYDACCRRLLEISARLGKFLHLHVDQGNHERDDGAERVSRLVGEMGLGSSPGREPSVWLVHAISPSAYPEDRFQTLLDQIVRLNLGVICCPSAAISMRQLRALPSPTHNSIARVLDCLARGVHVRLGSDNICDITSPAGTTDLLEETLLLANALRYYEPDILARLAAGQRLTGSECARVADHLAHDRAQCDDILRRLGSV